MDSILAVEIQVVGFDFEQSDLSTLGSDELALIGGGECVVNSI